MVTGVRLVVREVQAQSPHTLQLFSPTHVLLLKLLAGCVQVCFLRRLHRSKNVKTDRLAKRGTARERAIQAPHQKGCQWFVHKVSNKPVVLGLAAFVKFVGPCPNVSNSLVGDTLESSIGWPTLTRVCIVMLYT